MPALFPNVTEALFSNSQNRSQWLWCFWCLRRIALALEITPLASQTKLFLLYVWIFQNFMCTIHFPLSAINDCVSCTSFFEMNKTSKYIHMRITDSALLCVWIKGNAGKFPRANLYEGTIVFRCLALTSPVWNRIQNGIVYCAAGKQILCLWITLA